MDRHSIYDFLFEAENPINEWNLSSIWDLFYQELMSGDAPIGFDEVHESFPGALTWLFLTEEFPPHLPKTFLDVGCGISLNPHLMAFIGFEVTAVDFSYQAISYACKLKPNDDELINYLYSIYPLNYKDGKSYSRHKRNSYLKQLRKSQTKRGSVTYIQGDWLYVHLPKEAFNIIFCDKGLRRATKNYWLRSLIKFRQLLSPGGILIIDNGTWYGIPHDVRECFSQFGYTFLESGTIRIQSKKYIYG